MVDEDTRCVVNSGGSEYECSVGELRELAKRGDLIRIDGSVYECLMPMGSGANKSQFVRHVADLRPDDALDFRVGDVMNVNGRKFLYKSCEYVKQEDGTFKPVRVWEEVDG